jgi:hypothetical protein
MRALSSTASIHDPYDRRTMDVHRPDYKSIYIDNNNLYIEQLCLD